MKEIVTIWIEFVLEFSREYVQRAFESHFIRELVDSEKLLPSTQKSILHLQRCCFVQVFAGSQAEISSLNMPKFLLRKTYFPCRNHCHH